MDKRRSPKKDIDLAESEQIVGQLYPVLRAKNGDVIDGKSRTRVNKEWKSITLDISTKEEKLIATAHANLGRRTTTTDERADYVNSLAKLYVEMGLEVDHVQGRQHFNQVVNRLKEVLRGCMSIPTIMKVLDDKYKITERVERTEKAKEDKYKGISAWELLEKYYKQTLEKRFGAGFLYRLKSELRKEWGVVPPKKKHQWDFQQQEPELEEIPANLGEDVLSETEESIDFNYKDDIWGICKTGGCDNYGVKAMFPGGLCELCNCLVKRIERE